MAEEIGFFKFTVKGRRSFWVAVANHMPAEGFASDTISLFDGLYNLVLTLASVNQKDGCNYIFWNLRSIALCKHCYDPRAVYIKSLSEFENRLSCKVIGGISNKSEKMLLIRESEGGQCSPYMIMLPGFFM